MSSNTAFRFKKFLVHQDDVPMKINTDGVLLGAWVNVDGFSRIVDVGTGTGVIALMLAQRNENASITGVEIDEQAAVTASKNFSVSTWDERLQLAHASLQDYSPSHKVDLIVSNPPFFVNALKSPEAKKNQARHTDSLPHQEFLNFAEKFGAAKHAIAMVLPFEEGSTFIANAESQGYFLQRMCWVRSHKGKPPKRVLLELSNTKVPFVQEELIMHENGERGYSRAYKELTKEFFLAY